jgi:hypothetical protein
VAGDILTRAVPEVDASSRDTPSRIDGRSAIATDASAQTIAAAIHPLHTRRDFIESNLHPSDTRNRHGTPLRIPDDAAPGPVRVEADHDRRS